MSEPAIAKTVTYHSDPGDEQQRCVFSKYRLGTDRVHQCILPLHHLGRHESEGLPECCYTKNECFGRTSCPRNPSCSS